MLLAIDDIGPGPVVVLLHGFPFGKAMWEGQTGEIGSIYRIIAPDLRGHGSTAVPDGVYSMDLLADDVIETLDALRINEPIVLGGLSMGGYVALSIAARHPERLRGLMLMNTRAGADAPEAARVREELAREIERTGKIDAVVESMLPKLFSPATRAQRSELIGRVREMMMKTAPLGVINALRGMASRPDRRDDLPKLSMPTLVLAGEDDQLIGIAESKSMADAAPNARFAVIPKAGHLAPLENSADANAIILDFLKSLE